MLIREAIVTKRKPRGECALRNLPQKNRHGITAAILFL